MGIKTLRKRIAARWPFDAAHYPRIPVQEGSERTRFIADHISKHLSHECGSLSRFLEQLDHARDLAGGLDQHHVNIKIVPIIRDLLVGTLRLAEAVGVLQDHIDDALEVYLEKTVTLVKTAAE